MKKIISFILTAIMLVGVLSVNATAAGSLIFNDDFNTGFAPRNWVTDNNACAFSWDGENQCIYGYSDAVVLQSKWSAPYNKAWDKFYTSFDVQIKADDDGFDENSDEATWSSGVALWYRDKFEDGEKNDQEGAAYMFEITIQTGEAKLTKSHGFKYLNENGVLTDGSIDAVIAGPVTISTPIEVGEDAAFFNMGMRVTDGKIECYYNEELILSSEYDENDETLGGYTLNCVDSTVGSQKSPVLFWNFENWVVVDNFEVWSADYDFKSDVLYGDANGDGKVNITDASAIMKKVAGWTVEVIDQPADANADGKINLADASLILKYAAGWDVVLGPTE